MKFAFIEQHVSTWPVNVMCRMLGVSRSGNYDWRVRAPSSRTTANMALLHDVRRLQARNQGRYGSPRMHAALRAEGRQCSRGRVERLMRRHRIRGLAGRRFRPCTTDSRLYLPIAPNLLPGALRQLRQTRSCSRTSRISRPAKGGFIWPRSSIWQPARSSDGRSSPRFQRCAASLEWLRRGCVITCEPSCHWRP